ncbi:MAG TPA: hypothetical protein VI814_12455 [Candidatus Limnocylindria bacterium]
MRRTALGALALAAALLVAAPAMALAASPTPSASPQQQTGTLQIPLVGTGTNAVATITGFQVVDGVLTAVGTITGTVTTTTGQVLNLTNEPFSAPVTSVSGSCQILQLDIGAIHLDLLGLVVDLSPIHLNITAQQGSGNLLGNLLCAVAHLLDNTGATGGALAGLTNLLNQILAAL